MSADEVAAEPKRRRTRRVRTAEPEEGPNEHIVERLEDAPEASSTDDEPDHDGAVDEDGDPDRGDGLFGALWRAGIVNVLTVAGRELGSYFVSPMGWVVPALIVLPVSLFGYLAPLLQSQQASMSPIFDILVNLFLILLVPIYTMRLIAEERRSGTLEMMLTSPVRDVEYVLGKWLGAFVFFLASVAFTLVYVLLLDYFFPDRASVNFAGLQLSVAKLDWGLILSGYIGLILAGGAMVAIGLLASSLTQNQIIAAIVAFVVLLAIWYAGKILSLQLQPPVGTFFDYVSGNSRYTAFSSGTVALKDVVYFLSLVAGSLFLATRVLESRRWR